MALVLSALKQGILGVFKAQYPTGLQVGNAIGRVYGLYAQAAQAGVALPVFTQLEGGVFGGILGPAFDPKAGATAASVAGAFSDALLAFWTAPPVLFTDGINTGLSGAIPGLPALRAAMTSALSNLSNTDASAAQQIASALDTATRTIIIPLVPSNVPTPLT